MGSYNKKEHLWANMEAIRVALTLRKEKRVATPKELTTLKGYTGFGGLKCILMPANNIGDVAQWAKSEIELFPMVMSLHAMIKDYSASELEYRQYMQSLKSSVLTAFYTPKEVVTTIAESLKTAGVTPNRFLDPSAGLGEFVSAFSSEQSFSFEKDLLTGQMLTALHPETKTIVKGFEEIEKKHNGYFDVVSSNIPFGDIAVFDPAFIQSGEIGRKMARGSLHNYFFVKGIDTLREGGILAFITSQGVMNAPTNEPVREWLMNNCDLVSAIRLPNNLFSEIANTEVGSDLIVLQKNTAKTELTEEELLFIKSAPRPSGVMFNNYYHDMSRIVHTSWKLGTDPYGKPAIDFRHEGGVSGIATDMRRMLSEDFKQRLNIDLYEQHNPKNIKAQPVVSSPIVVSSSEPTKSQSAEQLSLFDLFAVETVQNTPVKKRSAKPKESPIGLRDTGELWWQKDKEKGMEPRTYEGLRGDYIKEGSLIASDLQVGVFSRADDDTMVFQPLDLSTEIRQKALLYIDIRNTYHELYNYELERQVENESLRLNLNEYYDRFVALFGNLNDRKNNSLIQMDTTGREVLALERRIDGQTVKADIFSAPVSFSVNEVTQVDTPQEALSASLNKFGAVDLEYMVSLLPDSNNADILQELHGRIYYNPISEDYEIAEKFIAGNVVAKAEEIGHYLLEHPDDTRAKESLQALKDATPTPIPFEDLDFNLGERWIPTGIYSKFASYLCETDVQIQYSPNIDQYSVNCNYRNANIWNKYSVRGEHRTYDGINLMKHALHNTTPNITKKIMVNGEEVKVRDSEAIQLANAKIDEMRSGFVDWLNQQSEEFRNRLEKLYNGKFNCFVRPQFDGSHQKFPDLDLKGLMIYTVAKKMLYGCLDSTVAVSATTK